MTVTVKGREALRAHLLGAVPKQIQTVLRGAVKAGASVIAEEAKQRCTSAEVSAAVKVKAAPADGTKAAASVVIDGAWERSVARWLEFGTSAHFISIDDSQREGRSVGRTNKLLKAKVLAIGGQPVGTTVFHPGATPHPFIRPARDTAEREAIAAAQAYVNQRMGSTGGSVDDD
jgi:hypothetical protein